MRALRRRERVRVKQKDLHYRLAFQRQLDGSKEVRRVRAVE
jgi:hypothetical protein